MSRRNLDGYYGESPSVSVRLTPDDRGALRELRERWGLATGSEVLRRALREAARPGPPAEAVAKLRAVADLAAEHACPVAVRATGWRSGEVRLTVAELLAVLDALDGGPEAR